MTSAEASVPPPESALLSSHQPTLENVMAIHALTHINLLLANMPVCSSLLRDSYSGSYRRKQIGMRNHRNAPSAMRSFERTRAISSFGKPTTGTYFWSTNFSARTGPIFLGNKGVYLDFRPLVITSVRWSRRDPEGCNLRQAVRVRPSQGIDSTIRRSDIGSPIKLRSALSVM